MTLADVCKQLAAAFRRASRETFDFQSIELAGRELTGVGVSGAVRFRVRFSVSATASAQVTSTCSICGTHTVCAHARAMIVAVDDGELLADVDERRGALTRRVLKRPGDQKPDAWKAQVGALADQLRYFQPAVAAAPRSAPKMPAGREVIYVVRIEDYRGDEQVLDVTLATRPAGDPDEPRSRRPGKARKVAPGTYKSFNAGLMAWAASPDPLDREIAEKVLMAGRSYDRYSSRQQVQFSLPVETSGDLIGRLARGGRLFRNDHYALHDGIAPIGWLSDDRFDLKFEVAGDGPKDLRLGICAVSPTVTVSQGDLETVAGRYFLDNANRIGLFRTTVPARLVNSLTAGPPVVVPRAHASDLIERLMQMPAGVGIEFSGCDDVRPHRIVGTPRPRIHVKAGTADAPSLEARVQLDYGGVMIPLDRADGEFYDRGRRSLVTIDSAFHEQSHQLLTSLGMKIRRQYDGLRVTLPKRKLPAIVTALIHHGWHVDAEGKLYRTGTAFNLDVVSGIDWFELQGTAHFDQTSIDLPKLLAALRSGQQSIVLDDGSIGMIPQAWIKQFGGLADLASGEDGSLKFGRSQVGLLDALLAQQGQANVDAQFTAARDALRAFDRIQPQEPPAGFVGTLRPYQQLALGWFEFLRTLGFGGCLADDMGLGKTIQVLAMLEQRRAAGAGPSLIVVPRSLVFNWTAEAKKFAPQLRVLDQSHAQRKKGTEHFGDYDLVLTTYGTLTRDAAFLKDFEFDHVILDEAQAIKNATTETSKAARLLRGRHRLALSGTPIENHLGELWSLFDFLNPGMLGRVGRFAGLAREASTDERTMLAAAVRPFILRRTKKQVAPELPDRVEQTVVVEMDPEQRRGYDELREYYRQTLLNKIDADGIGKSQIVILEALLRLRQAACHPGLIDKARAGEPSAKLDELLSRLTSAAETGERVLVFSQFTSLLAIVKTRLNKAKIDFLYLDGKTKDRQSLVEQFQSGTGPGVFLISLKAGGVGLNLTAARTVYLLDPWWNPAVEAQAIDRAHRIGQQQTVFATRLIAADTVEQKVLELQAKKKGLADAIINADNAGISSITREDLELLLA
jgi:superfamily II DNA or RNA helicase